MKTNSLGLTLGDYTGMSVGDAYVFKKGTVRVQRVEWSQWSTNGSEPEDLYKSYLRYKEKERESQPNAK